jgi:hypothetical protein
MTSTRATVDECVAEITRIEGQIEQSNFYDDPPSVIESLSEQLNAAQA